MPDTVWKAKTQRLDSPVTRIELLVLLANSYQHWETSRELRINSQTQVRYLSDTLRVPNGLKVDYTSHASSNTEVPLGEYLFLYDPILSAYPVFSLHLHFPNQFFLKQSLTMLSSPALTLGSPLPILSMVAWQTCATMSGLRNSTSKTSFYLAYLVVMFSVHCLLYPQ